MPQALDALRDLFGGSGPIAPMPDPRRRRFIMGEEGDDIVSGDGMPEEEPPPVNPAIAALEAEMRPGAGIRSFRGPSGTMTYTNRGTPERTSEQNAQIELQNADRAESVTRARNRVDQDLPIAGLTHSAGYERLLRDDPAQAGRALADVMQSASRMGNESLPRRPNIMTPGEEFSGVRSLLSSGRAKQQLGEEAADAETLRFMSPKSTAARAMAAGEREAAAAPERFGRIRERLAGNTDLSMMADDPMATLGLDEPEDGAPGGKIASMADVDDFARQNGLSPAQARQMFEAEGYVIEP